MANGIYLDNSLALSRKVMNREEKAEGVDITSYLGMMHSFKFSNSDMPYEMPIDHIGLALLTKQAATAQYSMTVVDPDTKEISIIKEPIDQSQGRYLADFLGNVVPNALNWYTTLSGEVFSNIYTGGKVLRTPTNGFQQTKVYHEKTGEDLRQMAIREGYYSSLREYGEQMYDLKDESQLNAFSDFAQNDMKVFEENLAVLSEQSQKYLPSTEQAINQ